jgi:hypothetical protein
MDKNLRDSSIVSALEKRRRAELGCRDRITVISAGFHNGMVIE